MQNKLNHTLSKNGELEEISLEKLLDKMSC
jgi:hypothetical protein